MSNKNPPRQAILIHAQHVPHPLTGPSKEPHLCVFAFLTYCRVGTTIPSIACRHSGTYHAHWLAPSVATWHQVWPPGASIPQCVAVRGVCTRMVLLTFRRGVYR
eukprot:359517-Chlamydomonas_euryale.AAC.32